MSNDSQVSRRYSDAERDGYVALVEALGDRVVPDQDVLAQLPLFLPRVALSHILFMDEIYREILDVPGSVAEFGVKWGRNLAILHSLRSIHEPFNFSRHIFGFDTFEGFPSVSDRDGHDPVTKVGGLSVPAGWEESLGAILEAHQKLSMRPDHRRFELVKGDVADTVPAFLEKNPHVVFSMLYLDLDLYVPTKQVLTMLWDRVPKGGLVVFDQINLDLFPGETLAMLEAVDLSATKLRRSRFAGYQAYIAK